MPPEVGKKYGPYEIQGRLGGGGMGHVYLAWDARLHREVAIKLLHNEYSMPGMRERFLREARAASALNHPNICTIFDIGEQAGDPYLVMELLQGETLKDRIQGGIIPPDELVCIAREVGEALGAAHAKGVIHRDIKPANIFLVAKPNGTAQAKVLDFGLAKIEGGVLGARTPRSLDITSPGATVGTLAYMSPEQARGETLDSRSDLFSLGVVLYEMATRHVPFQGATSALIFVQLLNHAPESIRSWNEAIPRDLEKIILKLMAKERTARFQTANELEEALTKFEKGGGGGWLRKAVGAGGGAAARVPEPVARDKRPLARRRSEPEMSPVNPGPVAGVAEATPRPSNALLRPVSRSPRPDATPAPMEDSEALVAQTAAPVASGSGPMVVATVAETTARSSSVSRVVPQPTSGEFMASLREDTGPPRRPSVFTPLRLGLLAALVLMIGVVAYLFLVRGRLGPGLLSGDDIVVLTEIENKTGDKSLDGAVAEGLQVSLSQSRFLRLIGRADYRAVRHIANPDASVTFTPIAARKVAEKLNAKAYLYGSISGTAPPYLLHVDLMNAGTSDVLTSAEEHIPSLQQIPDAIDHIAESLRFNAGEEREAISKSHTPLTHEATANLDALQLLSQGDEAYVEGQSVDALAIYQKAVALDPKFALAQLRLTVLLRKLRGELGAGEAAKAALAATDNAGERTRAMAQYEYEMNASGDYARAATIIRQVIAERPHDSQALESLARTLRLQGRFTESLQMAQQAYAEDPYNVDAYTQAENSLIGLDRYDAAAQLHAQVEKLGIAHVGGALTPAYLEGRKDVVDLAIAALTTDNGFRPDWNLGLYYDNAGHLAAGAAVWHSRAEAAKKIKGLGSAAGFLLSQGALDRAMLGDCRNGLAMAAESDANPQGITALFNVGMAYALCGAPDKARADSAQLQQLYPQSFAVRGFYVADITAAVALRNNDPAAVLEVLKPAPVYDLISLTPYLRGRAHVLQHPDIPIGIVDFETVLSHRGVPFIVGSVVYPIAEIGVARAFAETGDVNNSAGAYKRFLDLWKTADPNQPLVTEAREHTK